MNEIYPISTEYRGIVFRSRLEARWAVFFDFVNIPFRYEPRVDEIDFCGGLTFYKPDFWLIGMDMWVEVKPFPFCKLSFAETKKAEGWAKEYGQILILSGTPCIPNEKTESHYLLSFNEEKNKFFLIKNMWWCECPKCHLVGIRPGGGTPGECDKTCLGKPSLDLFGEEIEFDGHRTSRLKRACQKACKFDFVGGRLSWR